MVIWPSPLMVVWRKLCPQVIHDFHGFEKVGEESKDIFSNLVSLSEKLESELHLCVICGKSI